MNRMESSSRPRGGAHRWAPLVEEWEQSGTKAKAFCDERGLSLKSFQWWRWALRSGHRQAHRRGRRTPITPRDDRQAAAAAVGFLEVVPTVAERATKGAPEGVPGKQQRPGAGVEIVVRRGKELAIRLDHDFDADVFRRAVQLLEEESGC